VPRTTFAAPQAIASFVPIGHLFPSFVWPEDQFEGGDGLLKRVFATSWSVTPGVIEVSLFTETECALRLPGVDGLELVLGAAPEQTGPGIAFGLRLAFTLDGHWALTLTDVAVSLRWDVELLVAMEEDGAGGFVETGEPYGATLTGSVTLADDFTLDFGARSCRSTTRRSTRRRRSAVTPGPCWPTGSAFPGLARRSSG